MTSHGDFYTYNGTIRAKIYERDESKINTLLDMRRLIRYNDYKNDPLSKCNCSEPYSSSLAIATRGDLNPINMTSWIPGLGHAAHVATDGKVTSYKLMKEYNTNMISLIIAGPPCDDVPPFDWRNTSLKGIPHFGHV